MDLWKKNEVWNKAVAIENTLYNITYTGLIMDF